MTEMLRCIVIFGCTALCLVFAAARFPAGDLASSAGSRSDRRISAATRIENFELCDQWGQQRSLDEFRCSELIVVAFLGTECPLANLYASRLADLAEHYSTSEVQFLGIDANRQDSLREIAGFARAHKIPFPLLKDPDGQVADQFGAKRTPEVFLLDKSRTVCYRGRIDDQYAIGVRHDKPRQDDLAIAIGEVLAGGTVSTPSTEPVGCLIGRGERTEPHGDITYNQTISGILERRCISCHREGQAAPFSLTNFSEVTGWSAMIHEVVDEQRMPPWFASPLHGKFGNDTSLSNEERQLMMQWIENGCPLGEPITETPRAAFDSDWQIPTPDQIVFVQQEPFHVPAQGQVEYQYFEIDPGFEEGKYVTAVQVLPGNAQVVHHALISIADPNDIAQGVGNCGVLINYAPGMQPTLLTDGMAIHVPAGSKFLAQIHYTPNGTDQFDQTSIGFVFADPASVTQAVEGAAIVNTRIEIPAGARDHQEVAELELTKDIKLLSMSPHMHVRGQSFRYEAFFPDGTSEILLDVPDYDFNWQLRYVLAEPKLLKRGTRLVCKATYDNSADNRANPDANSTVRWGDQTSDEMLIGFFAFVEQ